MRGFFLMFLFGWGALVGCIGAESSQSREVAFPLPLAEYPPSKGVGLGQVYRERIAMDGFNLVATGIFLCAILHTFFAGQFTKISHRWRDEHEERMRMARSSLSFSRVGPREVSRSRGRSWGGASGIWQCETRPETQ